MASKNKAVLILNVDGDIRITFHKSESGAKAHADTQNYSGGWVVSKPADLEVEDLTVWVLNTACEKLSPGAESTDDIAEARTRLWDLIAAKIDPTETEAEGETNVTTAIQEAGTPRPRPPSRKKAGAANGGTRPRPPSAKKAGAKKAAPAKKGAARKAAAPRKEGARGRKRGLGPEWIAILAAVGKAGPDGVSREKMAELAKKHGAGQSAQGWWRFLKAGILSNKERGVYVLTAAGKKAIEKSAD